MKVLKSWQKNPLGIGLDWHQFPVYLAPILAVSSGVNLFGVAKRPHFGHLFPP